MSFYENGNGYTEPELSWLERLKKLGGIVSNLTAFALVIAFFVGSIAFGDRIPSPYVEILAISFLLVFCALFDHR
jgi:hypothetical protein